MASGRGYVTPTTLSEVREYVTGHSDGLNQSGHTVLLNVAHSNLTSTRFAELRLDIRTPISAVKERLYTHCGTLASSMTLLLRDSLGKIRAELSNESKPLGYYSPQNGDTLFVVDEDPNSASANGWLENINLVEKYTISEEAYNTRKNTYRKFRDEKRQSDPQWTMHKEIARRTGKDLNVDSVDCPDEAPLMQVGNRVEVFPGGRRAEIKFIGKDLQGLPKGWWLGVAYDEPVGKNDGTVKGVKYFCARPSHGGMVRPSRVTMGDFPPLGIDDDESEDEI